MFPFMSVSYKSFALFIVFPFGNKEFLKMKEAGNYRENLDITLQIVPEQSYR